MSLYGSKVPSLAEGVACNAAALMAAAAAGARATPFYVAVHAGVDGALLVVDICRDRLVRLTLQCAELLVVERLGSQLVFQDGLGFGHGGAKLLFGKQFVTPGAGIACGGVLAGDAVA